MRRLDSAFLLELDQTIGETNCCIEEVTSKDLLDQNAHFLCEDETSQCRAYCPLLRNTMTWPLQNLKTLASQRNSWTQKARQPRPQWHSERRLVRTETVRNVMADTRCAVFVWRVWWLTGSRCMNGSSFSPSQRTFHFSSWKSSSVKWLRVGPCSAANG